MIQKVHSIQAVIAVFVLLGGNAFAQGVLSNCAEQFINGDADNAPTIFSSSPNEPFGSNRHLCYRDDGVSFFAAEYWPEEFAPRWAAYKLSPENYGANGCATYTRKIANCYIREDTWTDFQNCTSGSDPFHTDHMLTGTLLVKTDFSNTDHDRGHIAPRQAFSWHVCELMQVKLSQIIRSVANLGLIPAVFEVSRHTINQTISAALSLELAKKRGTK